LAFIWVYVILEQMDKRKTRIIQTVFIGAVFLVLFLFNLRWDRRFINTIPLVGDEPSYMSIADSLATFKTANLIQEQNTKHFLNFFPSPDFKVHSVDISDTKHFPKHGLGWPIILTPFFFLSNNPRLFLVILQNIIVLTLTANVFLWLREKGYGFYLSLFVPFVMALSLPIAVQTYFLFYEPLAALCVIYALRKWEEPNWLSSLAVAFLPWIHIKYLIFVPLFLYPGIDFSKFRLNKLKDFWNLGVKNKTLVSLFLASILLVIGFNLYAYGSIFSGQEKASSFFSQYEGLIGLLVNLKDGLIASAPIYLAAFLGLGALFVNNRKLFWQVTYLAGFLWFMTGIFSDWSGGQAPTARMIMTILPVLAPALAEVLILPFKWFFRVFFGLLMVPSLMLGLRGKMDPFSVINKHLYDNLNIMKSFFPYDFEKWFPLQHKLGLNLNLLWIVIFVALFVLGFYLAKKQKTLHKIERNLIQS